jgi:hypothetical protein
MTWSAEWVQAWAQIGTLAVAVMGIAFVLLQIKQVNKTMRATANDRLANESLLIMRYLSDNSGLYDYFYNGKMPEPQREDDEKLKYATEMIANYIEHITLQTAELDKSMQSAWMNYIKDLYTNSPVIRRHLTRYNTWYIRNLQELMEELETQRKVTPPGPRSFN